MGRASGPSPAAAWVSLTAEAQERDPGSMLALYRAALGLRHGHPGLAGRAFRWLPVPAGVLAFERGAGFWCVVNVSGDPVPLLAGSVVLLQSDAGSDPGDPLPANAAAWLVARTRRSPQVPL